MSRDRASFARRALVWFRDGAPVPAVTLTCSSGHSWTDTSVAVLASHQRMSKLKQLWRAVEFNRTVIPTPQSYTVAFLAGLVVGAVGWAVSGSPLWLWAAPAAVVTSFVSATATAFRGAARHGTGRALQEVLDPGGASGRRNADRRALFAKRTFSVFGLANAPSEPLLVGHSGRADSLHSVSIGYGTRTERGFEGERIEVETELVDDLTARYADEVDDVKAWQFLQSEKFAEPRAWDERPGDSPLPWEPTEVRVDGLAAPAKQLRHDGAIFLITRVGSVRIMVTSTSMVGDIALVAIEPPEPIGPRGLAQPED